MFEHYASKAAFDKHNSLPIIQKLVNEDHYIKGVKAKFLRPIKAEGQ
jgi:quinol monooxygenase YgiN